MSITPFLSVHELAKRRDLRGERFHISFKLKSLVAKDQWDEYSKVGFEDFLRYVEHWFVLGDLTEHNGKPAITIVEKLPVMQVPLYCQGRYITKELIALFPAIDQPIEEPTPTQ